MEKYLVFDWGGTSLKYAWMDEHAEVLEKGSIPTPNKNSTKIEFYELLDSIVQKQEVSGVAISSTGVIDSVNGILKTVGALPFLNNTNIVEELSERYHTKVSIENDGRCAALAELWLGNLKDVDDGAVVVIGTNIGSAIILNHQLRRGKQFLAGEMCAMNSDEHHLNNPYSYIGQHGTPYLCKLIQEKKSLKEAINGVQAFSLIQDQDLDALEALHEYTNVLAMHLFNLNILLDLEKIVIGGGISEQPELMRSLKLSIKNIKTVHPDIVKGIDYPLPNIDVCKYHNEANLIGALYHFLYE